MRVYAEKPLRLGLQVLVDLLVVGWVVLAVRVSTGAQSAMAQWKVPGQQMIDAGGQLQHIFVDASTTAGEIPFVGNDFSRVLGRGTASGDVLAEVGRRQMMAVDHLSGATAVLIVVVALIPVLAGWLPRRIRFAREATRAAWMRTDAVDLLALRALNDLPYRRLRTVAADPAHAWRRADTEAIDHLANLQLARLGLRPLCRSTPDPEVSAGAAVEGATRPADER